MPRIAKKKGCTKRSGKVRLNPVAKEELVPPEELEDYDPEGETRMGRPTGQPKVYKQRWCPRCKCKLNKYNRNTFCNCCESVIGKLPPDMGERYVAELLGRRASRAELSENG